MERFLPTLHANDFTIDLSVYVFAYSVNALLLSFAANDDNHHFVYVFVFTFVMGGSHALFILSLASFNGGSER